MNIKKQTLRYIYEHFDEQKEKKINEQCILLQQIKAEQKAFCILGESAEAERLIELLKGKKFSVKYYCGSDRINKEGVDVITIEKLQSLNSVCILFTNASDCDTYKLSEGQTYIKYPFEYFSYDLANIDAHMASDISGLFDYLLDEESHQVLNLEIKRILATISELNMLDCDFCVSTDYENEKDVYIDLSNEADYIQKLNELNESISEAKKGVSILLKRDVEALWKVPFYIKKILPQIILCFRFINEDQIICMAEINKKNEKGAKS